MAPYPWFPLLPLRQVCESLQLCFQWISTTVAPLSSFLFSLLFILSGCLCLCQGHSWQCNYPLECIATLTTLLEASGDCEPTKCLPSLANEEVSCEQGGGESRTMKSFLHLPPVLLSACQLKRNTRN